MNRLTRTGRPALFVLLALALTAYGCGGDGQKNASQANAAPNASPQQADAPADASKLDAEVARLEKLGERNPGDDATRDALAKAYVRRGDAHRAAGRLQEALLDYQRALRVEPDNDSAQKNAAEVGEQLGVAPEGEYGEPAPLPITPNVTDDEEKPTPTGTPKRQ